MFNCSYCGVPHEDDERGEEHIVPEKLLNKRLKLRDTCQYWNNFFARSFESEISTSPVMAHALLHMAPELAPRGRVALAPVTRADGTPLLRSLNNGVTELRKMPESTFQRTFDLPAFDKSGAEHHVTVDLPMGLLIRVSEVPPSDAAHRARVLRKMAESRAAVEDYLRRVSRDPSIDPKLPALLLERGLTLHPVRTAEASVSRTPGGPSEVVTDLTPSRSEMSAEAWVKFYLKIAWCFACSKLGREKLIALGGERVLAYLKSGTVDASLVATCQREDPATAERLFRSAKIRSEVVWFWATVPDIAAKDLLALPHDGVRARLTELHRRRSEDASFFAAWVPDLKVVTLGSEMLVGDRRQHVLQLLTRTKGKATALFCRVILFGGILDVHVQLGPWSDSDIALASPDVTERIVW